MSQDRTGDIPEQKQHPEGAVADPKREKGQIMRQKQQQQQMQRPIDFVSDVMQGFSGGTTAVPGTGSGIGMQSCAPTGHSMAFSSTFGAPGVQTISATGFDTQGHPVQRMIRRTTNSLGEVTEEIVSERPMPAGQNFTFSSASSASF